jgi:ribosomal protein L13
VNLEQMPASAATPALVRAMSDLLGKLADQIAALLRDGGVAPH